MKTKTVGQILKEARESKIVSLSEMAAYSRIRKEYLEALEKNRFELLPTATFVKGYIKTYARILDLDSGPLLALLRRDFKESAKGELVPREFLAPVVRSQSFWNPITLVATLVATLFSVLLLYVGFQWYALNKPPLLEIFSPTDQEIVAAQVKVSGRTHPEATVFVNLQPVALQTDGRFETTLFFNRDGVHTITVEATDRRGKTSLDQKTVVVEF